jgi:hypothetical protein
MRRIRKVARMGLLWNANRISEGKNNFEMNPKGMAVESMDWICSAQNRIN